MRGLAGRPSSFLPICARTENASLRFPSKARSSSSAMRKGSGGWRGRGCSWQEDGWWAERAEVEGIGGDGRERGQGRSCVGLRANNRGSGFFWVVCTYGCAFADSNRTRGRTGRRTNNHVGDFLAARGRKDSWTTYQAGSQPSPVDN
jgi:hypothetical protein